MFRIPHLLAFAAGALVLVLATDASGQPPFGKGQFGKGGQPFQPPFGKGFPGKDDKKAEEKKDAKKGEEKKVEGRKGEEKKAAPKSDAVVDAWVAVLIAKITDPHDTVRDSARGALVGVGPPAIPALQALADGTDPAKAVAARKLINAIQGNRGPQPAQAGRPDFRGFPGFPATGPMGRPGGADRDRGPEPKRGGGGREVAPMPRAR